MSNNLENCNNIKLTKQKEYLKKEILTGNNDTYFKVLDLECGTGKSITTEEALAEITKYNKKALLVKERNSDCINAAKRINKLAANQEIAIAINSDTHNLKQFNKIKGELYTYSIVIISHEKYKVLAVDKKQREYFTKDRNILVIDEFLNMTKGNELSINLKWIEEFETFLRHRALRNQFAICIAEIEDYLNSKKKLQSFFNAKIDYKTICKEINKLKTLIKSNLDNEYLQEQGFSKTQVLQKVEELKQFYNQTCVVEGNTIYCTNRNYQYWLLDNNIILDASAKLNQAYKLNKELFHIQHQTPVLDHRLWSFFIMKTNTTVSGKNKAINFYDVVQKLIDKLGENTLVIGNKTDENSINAKYINHFGNVTGSNDYRELCNCVITHNPNIPYRYYILEHLYFSNETLDNRNSWSGSNSGKGDEMVYRFNEKKFETYRQCKNANEIYQAIKRVNRDMSQKSKIFIFNNDMETIQRVLDMFKGEKSVTIYDNKVKFEKSKQKEFLEEHNQKQHENRQAKKFINLLSEIMKLKHIDLQKQKKNRKGEMETVMGVYPKASLRNYMGITDKGQFTRGILNDADVIDYMARHNIINKGQTLDFTNAK